MNKRLRRDFYLALALIVAATVFVMPYRGVLIERVKMPQQLRYWTSPIRHIMEESLIGYYFCPRCSISEYDELIREQSLPNNIHWCLISAMAYVESRFKPYAVSNGGAIGLLQIMPRIGRSLGVEPAELFTPEVNIHIAIEHFIDIERMLSLPDDIDEIDRLSLILAGYNGGVGRVFDAQRLTRYYGGDPYLWCDVRPYLLYLRFEGGYTHPVVHHGVFRSAHYTSAYVRDVLGKYEDYLLKTANCPFHLYPYALRYE